MTLSIHELAYQCLMECDPAKKVSATQALYKQVIHNSSLVLNDPERALEFVAVWDQED